MHLLAVAIDHVHALGPRHVHMVLAVVHVNAVGTEMHVAAALLFEVDAFGAPDTGSPGTGSAGIGSSVGIGVGATDIARPLAHFRSLWRSGPLCDDDGSARAARLHAVGGLEGHVIFDGFVHVQKLIQRHPVELRQGNEVVGVGRRLRALPLGYGLARNAQLLRQGLLRQPRKLPACGQALGDFHVHDVLPFFCDCLPKTPWSLPKTPPPRNQFALSFPAIIGCGDDERGECPSDHRTHGGIRIR